MKDPVPVIKITDEDGKEYLIDPYFEIGRIREHGIEYTLSFDTEKDKEEMTECLLKIFNKVGINIVKVE